MTIRLILADSSDLVLHGLQQVLHTQDALEVVHMTRTVTDLQAALESLQPDLVIVNERLDPLLDVFAVIDQIQQRVTSKIIVLGSVADGRLMRNLLAVGVSGYLYMADDLTDCLPSAVRAVLRDRCYLSPTANAEYLVLMQSAQPDGPLDAEMRLMLRLLVEGQHMHDIAGQMNLSLRRVYRIREKLRERFGASTNEHLISRAVLEGFTASDS